MDLQLHDRVALIVGGCGSIGQAVVGALRSEGARVCVADRGEALAVEGIDGIEIEVANDASVQVAVRRAVDRHARIDVLVYLVGIYQAKPLVDIAADEWDRVLDVNLKGAFLVCREVLPIMQRTGFGRMILVASLAGQVGGVVAGAHYAASKAGVLSLVKSLARQARMYDRGAQDITVNAVSPGPVESRMTSGWTDEERQRMTATIPVGRFAQPQEVADAIAFLASPRSGYIHGARLDVNGGAFLG